MTLITFDSLLAFELSNDFNRFYNHFNVYDFTEKLLGLNEDATVHTDSVVNGCLVY